MKLKKEIVDIMKANFGYSDVDEENAADMLETICNTMSDIMLWMTNYTADNYPHATNTNRRYVEANIMILRLSDDEDLYEGEEN